MTIPQHDNPADGINDIVLVHGLWFRAVFMRVLAGRLERRGFRVHSFDWSTTRAPITESALALRAFCDERVPGGAHLVGHSLGGLLILSMLAEPGWSAPGRVVFLGTPLQGSAVARRVRGWPGGEWLIGHAAMPLDSGMQGWPRQRDVGLVAGTMPVGLGVIAGGLPRPNDGVVAGAETRHEGLDGRIVMSVSHTGMLFSDAVATQVTAWLREGQFLPGEVSS
ncbi:alpha/beta fold hydrolase [Marinihelvus fidelis]|uniref:Alpha/beta fold hydrolase n=1 Tax=Marinihelvus fidelis TaxID=2613842 RepID=A0A5N0TEH5_9GAMM|nr:alpha/beta hydrolase [Marinihelvus fidelis]KAA9133503.1 alpha/beta fold hydrolase [Marinihelvus fidelis]